MFHADVERDFNNTVFSGILEEVVEWIKNNMDPDEIFDEADLKEWASDYDLFSKEDIPMVYDAEEVYSYEDLEQWASENYTGYEEG